MSTKELHAVIYKDAGSDQWAAICLEYNIGSQGDSEEDALRMIQEAVEFHLEDIDQQQLDAIDNAVGSEPVIHSFKIRAPAILDG